MTDKEIKETIEKKIRESDNLEAMGNVPDYLWIIYSIFQYNHKIPAPRMMTDLYIWILGIYLREHFKGSNHDKEIRSIPFPNLFKVKEIQNLLFNVSKFSIPLPQDWTDQLTPSVIEDFVDNAGPTTILSGDKREIYFSQLLFPENLFSLIANETNKHADQTQQRKGQNDNKWHQDIILMASNGCERNPGIHWNENLHEYSKLT